MKNTTNYIPQSDLDKVANLIIEHIGIEKSINAHAICKLLNLTTEGNHAYCRMLITEVIKEYNLPIISSRRGYCIAKDKEELGDYIQSLDNYIQGIEERKQMVLSAFK